MPVTLMLTYMARADRMDAEYICMRLALVAPLWRMRSPHLAIERRGDQVQEHILSAGHGLAARSRILMRETGGGRCGVGVAGEGQVETERQHGCGWVESRMLSNADLGA